jgi:hypothetical protein
MPTRPTPAALLPPTEGRRHFTITEARRTLVYVKSIVRDIRDAYRAAVALQHRLEYPLPDENIDRLRQQYEGLMDNLNRFVDELHEVGVELKDYDLGLVDFPALHDGREIFLCWKYGEPDLEAWHELDAGFTGRQPLAALQSPADSPDEPETDHIG